MRNYAELFIHGNTAQLEKLQENEHKEGLTDLPLDYIIKRIGDELTEASVEVFNKKINYKEARKEFADIANFAHMGIIVCDKVIDK